MTGTRTEHDLIGERQVPADRYFGIQTLRALENFEITRIPISHYPQFIDANFLSATNVCYPCHSPGGSFDGVDSTGNSIGAKDYWADAIYPDLTSKEKWCAGWLRHFFLYEWQG